ncbi:ferric reductase-like transmembrane domain-containing protein [Streptomyces sp. NPDC046939]|uniref:ferric reductase-like transmembrane domain-containing protein n=1 Tax=Streptomyces sp. NPDC046939 TaxID=3155376 RepID=UPI0033C11B50
MSAAVLLLIPVVVITGSDAFRAALDFTTGVLSLVSLTASVVWGLVASDRLFLTSRQRLLSQGVHRATAVASLGFLLLHVSVKLALAHVTLVEALIPFGSGVTGSSGLIGLGVLAGLLMVTTGITGALRSSMASPAALAARWRATHMLAYPAWCLALLHGLYAGRPPKTYVVVLYGLCLLGVAGAVALRAAPRTAKRKVATRVLAFLDPGPRAPGKVLRNTPPAPRTPDGVLRNTPPHPRTPDGVLRNTSPAPHTPDGVLRNTPLDPRTPDEVIRTTPLDPPARPAPPPIPPSAPAPNPPSAPAPATPTGIGFSAAYRAVSASPRVETTPPPPPPQRWPTPSPPPPAQAPQSSYDPLYETPYEGFPTYEGDATHNGTGEPHETNGPYETYPPHEPPTEPLPGPFQAPASGEPWSTPYGGTQ